MPPGGTWDTVRFVLFETGPAGLLFPQRVCAGDLSAGLVRSGFALLKDRAGEEGWRPLVWTRANGCQRGAERAALEACERAVVREEPAGFRRLVTGTIAPHAGAYPGGKWVEHITVRLNSIESALDLVVSS